MSKILEWIVIAVIAVFCVLATIGIIVKNDNCTKAGGILVRGVFGHECIRR